MANFGPHRHGVLFHYALCPFRAGRGAGRVRDAGNRSGIDIRWRRSDHVRSTAADDKDPLRLDCGRFDPIRDRRRNHWRDL